MTSRLDDPRFANPLGSMANPAPSGPLPVSFWSAPGTLLTWTSTTVIDPEDELPQTPLPAGVLYAGSWTTPVFDLRPDLKANTGEPQAGVPMHSRSARLFVQLSPGDGAMGTFDLAGVRVTATDLVNATGNNVRMTFEGSTGGGGLYGLPPSDVTSALISPAGVEVRSMLGGFAPPGTNLGFGEGYPIRYWRVRLDFSLFIPFEDGVLPDPLPSATPILVTGSMY